MLDFSVLEHLGKVAIHCVTERDAEKLLQEMWSQHPELMRYWNRTDTKWHLYESHTCYALHIYDREAECMQYCNTEYWLAEGYSIIPFDDLTITHQDFGEIETGDASLSILLS